MQQGSLAGAAAGTLLGAHGDSEGAFALDAETLMSVQEIHPQNFSTRFQFGNIFSPQRHRSRLNAHPKGYTEDQALPASARKTRGAIESGSIGPHANVAVQNRHYFLPWQFL